MAQKTSLGSIAGELTRRGHTVTAVLDREELAWEGLEEATPVSIADMIVEVGEHPHGGNKDLHKTLNILGLTTTVKILDVQDKSANTVQHEHAALVLGIHNYLDTRYVGYDARHFLGQMRIGPRTIIFTSHKSEDQTIVHALPKYRSWLKAAANGGWAPENMADERFGVRDDDEGDNVG